MCIFVERIEVGQTKIAVARCNQGQFTMYDNTVSHGGGKHNAMILPIPADAATVELIDLSAMSDPWVGLEDATPKSPSYGNGSGNDEYDLAEFCALEVEQVGGYRCSIAPTLADLARSLSIPVPPNIEAILAEHYGSGFCFLICQFDADNEAALQMHPIAYTHALSPTGALFIPTRHAHGGDAQVGEHKKAKLSAQNEDDGGVDEFDHILYVINAKVMTPPSAYDWQHCYTKTLYQDLTDFVPANPQLGSDRVHCPIKWVQKVAISAASQAPNADQWAE